MLRILFYLALLHAFPCHLKAQELQPPGLLTLKDPKEIISIQLKSLDHLIEMTTLTLENLRHLQTAITNYQTVQNLYLNRTSDKELLFRMTKMADQLLKEIKAAHLSHTFDVEFLSELKLLAKIYRKSELPKL
ncbi:MAG: hypothetical protein H0T62_03210 [Parachlamydiaceae bacterium]|nr:hypothetical protein [Parachlamydiaceae bacterium]